jgi:LmbE family N-acetylglucosaminyl deacetylase
MKEGLLTIFAHPDDETFGCGGALALHSELGYDVGTLCLTGSDLKRKTELKRAAKTLGIKEPVILNEASIKQSHDLTQKVSKVIVNQCPKIVITHIPFDYHQEHRITYEIVKEALEWAGHETIFDNPWVVEKLLLMEVNTLIPKPHVIMDISNVWLKKKAAINDYTTQLEKFQWGYYQKFMGKKAELRGIQGSCNYAEAYLIEPLSKNSPFYPKKATKTLFE